jgi:hypothetical protein
MFPIRFVHGPSQHGFRMFGGVAVDHGGRGNDLLRVIAVVIGLVMTYYHIYGWVREWVRHTIQTTTTIILDIHGEKPGRGATQQQDVGAGDAGGGVVREGVDVNAAEAELVD